MGCYILIYKNQVLFQLRVIFALIYKSISLTKHFTSCLFQSYISDMSVNHGSRDIRMSEKFLNGADISPLF